MISFYLSRVVWPVHFTSETARGEANSSQIIQIKFVSGCGEAKSKLGIIAFGSAQTLCRRVLRSIWCCMPRDAVDLDQISILVQFHERTRKFQDPLHLLPFTQIPLLTTKFGGGTKVLPSVFVFFWKSLCCSVLSVSVSFKYSRLPRPRLSSVLVLPGYHANGPGHACTHKGYQTHELYHANHTSQRVTTPRLPPDTRALSPYSASSISALPVPITQHTPRAMILQIQSAESNT